MDVDDLMSTRHAASRPARRFLLTRAAFASVAALLTLALATSAVFAGAAGAATSPTPGPDANATATFAHASASPSVSSPPPATADQTRWSVHPATATSLDKRNLFDYTNIEPGAGLSDYVAISNDSTHPVTFAVYASDAHTTSVGGYDLLPQAQKPTDVGSWITLGSNSVTIPANGRAYVPFTVRVPTNATPGDHSGGIVAQVTTTSASGSPVSLDERVGTRVYLRVAGALTPKLSVDGLLTSYRANLNPVAGGTTVVTYTVHNIGDVRLAGSQKITVSGWFGSVSLTPPALAQLLPGNSIQIHAEVHGVWPAGGLTAKVTVTPAAVAGSSTPTVTAVAHDATLFEFPWPQLIALIVLVALVLGLLWLRRWRRARLAAAVAAAEQRGRAAAGDARPGDSTRDAEQTAGLGAAEGTGRHSGSRERVPDAGRHSTTDTE